MNWQPKIVSEIFTSVRKPNISQSKDSEKFTKLTLVIIDEKIKLGNSLAFDLFCYVNVYRKFSHAAVNS